MKNKKHSIEIQNEQEMNTSSNIFVWTGDSVCQEKGITLVALVVTIIVLVILVGVTVSAVINFGLITNSKRVVGDYNEEQTKERQYIQNVANIMDEYGSGGTGGEDTYIETTVSYVGCYADLNGDGTPDGIIYADLAIGGEGRWNNDSWSDYQYEAETEGLKSYTIGEKVTSDKFGNYEKEMITEVEGTTGKDRFYVMALEDVDSNMHYWYYNAYGKLDDVVATSANDFGTGKAKTEKMIENWNKNGGAGSYGSQNAGDLWGIIQNEEIKAKYDLTTWFVPSKSEWSAFGDMLYSDDYEFKVTTSNYENLGLSGYYWSSSQGDADNAYLANFRNGYIEIGIVDYSSYVRLSATF